MLQAENVTRGIVNQYILIFNEALHDWYCLAVSKNVYPDGRILKEKALEIAARLGCNDFKASNGWLDRWKKTLQCKADENKW